MATSKQAGPSTDVQAAAEISVLGFDAAKTKAVMLAMAEKRSVIDEATGELQDSAVALCRQAEHVARVSAAEGIDSDTIDAGWSAEIRALLPSLAHDGCSFVKESEKKPGKFVLTGYGQNVNSTARGFCQYPGELTVDGCAPEEGEPTISGIMKAVRERRAEDASEEEKALRAAKQLLSDAIKAYRDTALEGGKAERIVEFAEALTLAVAEQVEVEAEADADDDAEAVAA